MCYDFNCYFCEDLNAISLNLLVHKWAGHEICEKLIVSIVYLKIKNVIMRVGVLLLILS